MYEQEIEKLYKLAPEMSKLDEKTVKMVMEMASYEVSQKYFGKSYTLALIYYTAHLLSLQELAKREGATGSGLNRTVTSEHEGSLSRSYGEGLSSNSFFAKSIYGIMFERLKKQRAIPVLTRMG